MTFRIEGKDIVISGWEQGIADSPYQGIADMRNIDITSVPGEAAVTFGQTAVTVPPVFNAVAYTAQNTGDTITVASTTGLYNGCAIVLASNTAGGLSNSVVYYVGNITATTFQLYLSISLSPVVAITSNGSGTLTTYQYGRQRGVGVERSPLNYYVDQIGEIVAGVYLVDASNYAWFLPVTTSSFDAYKLLFMGNIGGIGAGSSNRTAIVVWEEHLILIGDNGHFDIASLDDLFSNGPAATWDYSWETPGSASNPEAIVSQEDGNLYWTTRAGIGSLIEEPGENFDPTDPTTYAITDEAINLPPNDQSICLTELGPAVYIGGINEYVYVWDKLSKGFNQIITMAERYTTCIVGTDQNVFMFVGNQGSIYVTNGAACDLYKKLPVSVMGTTRPYVTFTDANYSRGNIYFACTTTDNSSTDNTNTAGAWAINVETKALRLLNKTVNNGYAATTSMICPLPRRSSRSFTQPTGNGLLVGWNVSTTSYGLDIGLSTPYTSTEAYIDTDMIPVGTFLKPFTPSQIEWKTSVPLGGNGTSETIAIYYRTDLSSAYTLIGTTTSTGTTVNGASSLSDLYKANFEKVQWVQLRIILSSNATTPTYARLTEVRIRDYPSQI